MPEILYNDGVISVSYDGEGLAYKLQIENKEFSISDKDFNILAITPRNNLERELKRVDPYIPCRLKEVGFTESDLGVAIAQASIIKKEAERENWENYLTELSIDEIYLKDLIG